MSYSGTSAQPIDELEVGAPRSFRALRRLIRRPVAVVAVCVILIIYLAGILAPLAAPQGFRETDLRNPFAGPSIDHPLGTDRLGRDLLSRAMWSAQTTVIISIASVTSGGLVLGVSLGLLAGYARGAVDSVIMRLADFFAAVPTILLLLMINVSLKDRVIAWSRDIEDFTGFEGLTDSGAPDYFLVATALGIFGWVGIARLVRSQTLSVRESNYIFAARASGASTARVLFRHLLPNLTNLLVVAITLSLGAAAGLEIGLTFLGIGVHAPHPSFGIMIEDGAGLTTLRAHPILMAVPAVVVASLLLSFNLLGDVLTDVLSPRRR
jgi:ABC-type dipeptide/oligopeptide/nickel transport system permease subunit